MLVGSFFERVTEMDLKLNIQNCLGWLTGIVATAIYLLTLEPSVSFWDCGEFIATSYGLEIGHPPGAPLYQLLAHCFMLLAGGNVAMLPVLSNALSALAGGATAMFLFWTLLHFLHNSKFGIRNSIVAAEVGTFCYVLCDTAWFSAVESEVYSLSMLFSSAIVWAMVRWSEESCYSDFMVRVRHSPALFCHTKISSTRFTGACTPSPRGEVLTQIGRGGGRWLLLVSLLLGLSVGVHQLSLLTVPFIVLIYIFKRRRVSVGGWHKRLAMCLLFFVLGITPYAIIPIRAAANPPINQGNPSTLQALKAYFSREQYEKAPLIYGRCFNSPIVAYKDGKPVYAKEMDMFFPRMWKSHANAELYYTDWCGRHGKMVEVDGRKYYKPSFGDNLVIFGGYQLGYMYLRYLMWNFSGRYNDRQGFGNLQKGQFITGIPPIDKLYVGTGARQPEAMPTAGNNRYFMLPLILGLIGLFAHRRRNKGGFWLVMTLFLMGGIILSIYLNHPMYEPRERDYAYVLSFYAFAIWIGIGAAVLLSKEFRRKRLGQVMRPLIVILVVGTPLLVGCQNWDDHDRSGRYIAHDAAANLLNSCDENAILFTIGDNDTFPLWYMQEVEGFRRDVQVVNISLLGGESYCESTKRQMFLQGRDLLEGDEWRATGPYGRMRMIVNNNGGERPVYFSRYARRERGDAFAGRLQLCGMAYMLSDTLSVDSVDVERSYRLMTESLKWHNVEDVYIDEISNGFLMQYWNAALLTAENLAGSGDAAKGCEVLDATCAAIPAEVMKSPQLMYDLARVYGLCGATDKQSLWLARSRDTLAQLFAYYNIMSPTMQQYIPYTLAPLVDLADKLRTDNY